MHFAKSVVANALIDGWKSVELCQVYMLMSIYAIPVRCWEEDRSRLYTGLAIQCALLSFNAVHDDSDRYYARIATDPNLNLLPSKKPTTEQQELEMLNHTCVWIICFNLDKSITMQFGKPSMLKED